jgi:hypothetical protein
MKLVYLLIKKKVVKLVDDQRSERSERNNILIALDTYVTGHLGSEGKIRYQ